MWWRKKPIWNSYRYLPLVYAPKFLFYLFRLLGISLSVIGGSVKISWIAKSVPGIQTVQILLNSDPVTIKWLNDVASPTIGFPSIVRFSWATVTNLLKKKFPGSQILLKYAKVDKGQTLLNFPMKRKAKK